MRAACNGDGLTRLRADLTHRRHLDARDVNDHCNNQRAMLLSTIEVLKPFLMILIYFYVPTCYSFPSTFSHLAFARRSFVNSC